MRNGERDFARRKLDKELRFYRLAGKEKHPTQELLRRVRQSEGRGTISLRAMTRVANAMNCKVVYAVIPHDGKTLEEMADRRKWSKLLG
jgi:hypothetical protein